MENKPYLPRHIYRHNNPDGRALTYLKDGNDRRRTDKGCRLDKFLVTEDLMDTNVTFSHTRDFFYTGMFGMQDNSFDHGSVRTTFDLKKTKAGPGQFKLDPFLIKTGALDSVVKQTIYKANLFTTENAERIKNL